MENNNTYSEDDLIIHKKGVNPVTYYTDNIMWVIKESFWNAERYIKANMAYLTNHMIVESLIELAEKKIKIELIIGNNDTNNKNLHLYNKLLDAGVVIFQNGDDDWRNGIMHRKSVIIDDDLLLCGSYNWTEQAEKNLEELIVIEESQCIQKALNHFNNLRNISNQLKFQSYSLGAYKSCAKDKKIEIQNWWNALNTDWRRIFQKSFNLKTIPTESELIQLSNCRYLVVNFEREIEDIEPLKIFTNLNHLVIYDCPKVSDLKPLSELSQLKILDVAVTAVEDLTPISNLRNLEELNISNTKVKNLDPINNIPLQRIIIYNLDLFEFFGPTPTFFKNNPNCKINFA